MHTTPQKQCEISRHISMCIMKDTWAGAPWTAHGSLPTPADRYSTAVAPGTVAEHAVGDRPQARCLPVRR